MAKYPNLTVITEQLAKRLEGTIDRSYLKAMGKRVRDIVYRRTKSGKGMTRNGRENSLRALSPSYVEYRKGNIAFFKDESGRLRTYKPKKKPKLGAYGTPTKSNLTLTGEMLESIEIRITRYGVVLGFPRRKHKLNKRVTIREIAKFAEENGRPFFYISQAERRIIVRDLQLRIRKAFRK